MQLERKEVDRERGIIRVTTTDERWYIQSHLASNGKVVETYVPSVTWITGYYPKGVGYYKWLADKGWDESRAIMEEAGEYGSAVHNTIERWLQGEEIRHDSHISVGFDQMREITAREYAAVLSFIDWLATVKPVVHAVEEVTFSRNHGYAGTVDIQCDIDGQRYIIDLKTSQNVWASHKLQVSAYKHSLIEEKKAPEDVKLAILQVGYQKNKNGYKWNEIDDQFDLFLSAKKIWANETNEVQPKQKDYPIVLPSMNEILATNTN